MATISILVPVYRRPHRAAPLVESTLAASTVDIEVVFVCTARDHAEITACQETGARVELLPGGRSHGDYARKINHGIRVTDSPYVFQAADDLRFERGWDERVIREAERPGTGIVGTVDLGNRRTRAARHSTHSLITREYAQLGTIDDTYVTLHEGYQHNFVDDELVATARHRGAYRPSNAIVEHLHPNWRKAPRDLVYDLGEQGFQIDRRLFEARRLLWEPETASLMARRARR